MAAPAKSNRVHPNSYPMVEGFRSLVVMSANASIFLWEREVQFAGGDGGDPIDTANMLTTKYQTSRPRVLIKGTDLTMTCAYTGGTVSDLENLLNVEQTFTQIFPDAVGHWAAFFGWLMKYTPQNHQIGAHPQVQVVIHRSDWDSANNVEAGPAYGTGAVLSGTGT